LNIIEQQKDLIVFQLINFIINNFRNIQFYNEQKKINNIKKNNFSPLQNSIQNKGFFPSINQTVSRNEMINHKIPNKIMFRCDDNNIKVMENKIFNIIKDKENNSINNKKTNDTNKINYQSSHDGKKRKELIFENKKLFSIRKKEKNAHLTSKKRKIILNNKLVYIQSDQKEITDLERDDSYEEKEELKNLKSLNIEDHELIQNKKSRRSKYRGVSKNGSQWQVLIMAKKKKKYMGSYSSEEEAAKVYDKFALLYHGRKAKTNYDYSKEEIEKLIYKK
jgi:hypothetical protein